MSSDNGSLDVWDRHILEQHFDRNYYLSAYADVAAAQIDPLLHYHATGWREGRNPSRTFNTLYYLQLYADVAQAGMNPLLHYALSGQSEGRRVNRLLDGWRRQFDKAIPPEPEPGEVDKRRAKEWLGGATLLQALQERINGGPLVLSVSHDDYCKSVGGVQILISDEQTEAAELGWNYLHIAPARHCKTLAPDAPPDACGVSLRLDSEWIGHADMQTLICTLVRLRREISNIEVVIHHMMAHSPELLVQLIHAVGCRHPLLWVHDFFTVCPGYTLLRNDVVFCGGPPPHSSACAICCYGEARQMHSQRIRNFFNAAQPMILAPSDVALAQWRRVADHPISGACAFPLARLALGVSADHRLDKAAERPLRVAHIGGRIFHKGWLVFEELAEALRGDSRYNFYQLGEAAGAPFSENIRQIPVSVTRDTRWAMVEAIAENSIDVVVSWSAWPETFCFAAHEAIAGGAFVVTHHGAGNVPAMVAEGAAGRGMVLEEDRPALIAMFRNGELARRVAGSRRRRGALLLSGGAIGWLKTKLVRTGMRLPRTRGSEVRVTDV